MPSVRFFFFNAVSRIQPHCRANCDLISNLFTSLMYNPQDGWRGFLVNFMFENRFYSLIDKWKAENESACWFLVIFTNLYFWLLCYILYSKFFFFHCRFWTFLKADSIQIYRAWENLVESMDYPLRLQPPISSRGSCPNRNTLFFLSKMNPLLD